MALANFLTGTPSMPKSATATTDLAAAVLAIDFAESNAEMARLDAEQRTAHQKAAEAEAEAERLGEEIRNWSGPNAETLADAMLAGASPGETALAAPTREQLVDRRQAMLATAGALRERAERWRQERDDVAASQRLAILDAAEVFIAEQMRLQCQAAQELVNAIAAVNAVREMAGLNYEDVTISKARRGVTGADSILGPVDRIAVPADLVTALKPLEARAKGLRPVPVTIANS